MPLAPLADPWQKVDVQAEPDVSVMSVFSDLTELTTGGTLRLLRVDPHK